MMRWPICGLGPVDLGGSWLCPGTDVGTAGGTAGAAARCCVEGELAELNGALIAIWPGQVSRPSVLSLTVSALPALSALSLRTLSLTLEQCLMGAAW